MHKVRSIIANEITDSIGKGEGVTKVQLVVFTVHELTAQFT